MSKVILGKREKKNIPSLKLTANTPENGWLEYDPFLWGWPIFRCEFAVSFRECIMCCPWASNLSVDGMAPVTHLVAGDGATSAAQNLLKSTALYARHKRKTRIMPSWEKKSTCLKTWTITLELDDSTTFSISLRLRLSKSPRPYEPWRVGRADRSPYELQATSPAACENQFW